MAARTRTEDMHSLGERGIAVNLAGTNVRESLEVDFGMACADLALARQAVRIKDTPAARARIVECTAILDTILDLKNAGAWS